MIRINLKNSRPKETPYYVISFIFAPGKLPLRHCAKRENNYGLITITCQWPRGKTKQPKRNWSCSVEAVATLRSMRSSLLTIARLTRFCGALWFLWRHFAHLHAAEIETLKTPTAAPLSRRWSSCNARISRRVAYVAVAPKRKRGKEREREGERAEKLNLIKGVAFHLFSSSLFGCVCFLSAVSGSCNSHCSLPPLPQPSATLILSCLASLNDIIINIINMLSMFTHAFKMHIKLQQQTNNEWVKERGI